jgi:hypothetical protein
MEIPYDDIQALIDYLQEEEARDFEYLFFERAEEPETNVSIERLEEAALGEFADEKHVFTSMTRVKRWLEAYKCTCCQDSDCSCCLTCPIHGIMELEEVPK